MPTSPPSPALTAKAALTHSTCVQCAVAVDAAATFSEVPLANGFSSIFLNEEV